MDRYRIAKDEDAPPIEEAKPLDEPKGEMLKEIVSQWDANKDKLEARFRSGHPGSYENIVRAIFELVISDFDISRMTVIDDGEYQGTTIYIIPRDTYQPSVSDYLMTNNSYGSCSGCDTLEGIRSYDDGVPSDEQVREYMMLALHLIQRMKFLSDM